MSGVLSRLRGGVAAPRPRSRPLGDDEVLAAAVDQAFAVGLHGVTLETVAQRVGATVDDVARFEATDGALQTRVFQRVAAAELAEVKRSVLGSPGVLDQLHTLVGWLVEPGGPEVTSVWLGGWSLGWHDASMAAVVRGEMEAWEVFVSSLVRRGMREGVFRQTDPDFIAAELIGLVDSINAYMLVGHSTGVDRRRLVNGVLEGELGIDLGGVPVTSAQSVNA